MARAQPGARGAERRAGRRWRAVTVADDVAGGHRGGLLEADIGACCAPARGLDGIGTSKGPAVPAVLKGIRRGAVGWSVVVSAYGIRVEDRRSLLLAGTLFEFRVTGVALPVRFVHG